MKRLAVTFLALVTCIGLMFLPATAFAFDVFGNSCPTGGAAGSSSAVCQDNSASQSAKNPNPLTGPNGLLITVANIVAAVAGVVAVVVIVISGAKYITSGGDASKVQAAKGTLIGAVIGLVVIALADVIIGFVISKL